MNNTAHITTLEDRDCLNNLHFQAAEKCLHRHIPFALFAYPGEHLFHFYSNPTGKKGHSSFIISPWLSKFGSAVRIYNECSAKEILNSDYSFDYKGDNHFLPTTSKEEYITKIERLIDNLKDNNSKVVISRIITEKDISVDYIKLAKLQFGCYPNTFRFMYFSPQTGAWLGTSPELFFDYNTEESTFSTMSLAGTRKQDEAEPWDTKNILEQNFVARYIAKILDSYRIPYSITRSNDVNFYPVCHICDIFTGKVSRQTVNKLIDALNPTPALGGFPLNDALKYIREIETHDRKCYGGYIGIENPQRLLLHVNLRSMTFGKDYYCVYAGGGITENSIPEQEWNETKNKCITLIENINKCKQ